MRQTKPLLGGNDLDDDLLEPQEPAMEVLCVLSRTYRSFTEIRKLAGLTNNDDVECAIRLLRYKGFRIETLNWRAEEQRGKGTLMARVRKDNWPTAEAAGMEYWMKTRGE